MARCLSRDSRQRSCAANARSCSRVRGGEGCFRVLTRSRPPWNFQRGAATREVKRNVNRQKNRAGTQNSKKKPRNRKRTKSSISFSFHSVPRHSAPPLTTAGLPQASSSHKLL